MFKTHQDLLVYSKKNIKLYLEDILKDKCDLSIVNMLTQQIRPRGITAFFMLDSTEHGISTAYKN